MKYNDLVAICAVLLYVGDRASDLHDYVDFAGAIEAAKRLVHEVEHGK